MLSQIILKNGVRMESFSIREIRSLLNVISTKAVQEIITNSTGVLP